MKKYVSIFEYLMLCFSTNDTFSHGNYNNLIKSTSTGLRDARLILCPVARPPGRDARFVSHPHDLTR